MKFGIRETERDSTPGFRGTTTYDWWYASEAERDARYDYLTCPASARTEYIRNKGVVNDYVSSSYEKIER